MKLSVNLILSELKSEFPEAALLRKNKSDDSLSFQCPLFCEGDPGNYKSGQIYVLDPDQLASPLSPEGHCLLILSGRPPDSTIPRSVSCIIVPDSQTVDLYNQVVSIFRKYTDWDDHLQELVFRNVSLDVYLKISYPIIGNPMSIHNNNFNYLARMNTQESSHAAPSPQAGRDIFDPDFLLRVDAQSEQSVFSSKDLIFYQDRRNNNEHYFLNLFNGNTVAGRLVVSNLHRPFQPQDAALIQHLSRYLESALSFAAFTGTGKNLRRDSLLDYLSGKPHSDDKIMHLKTISPLSKLEPDQNLYCVVGRLESEYPEQYIMYQLEEALPDSVCVLLNSYIVFVTPNESGQSQEELFRRISSLLEEYSITAGCSNPFTDFYDLKFCYKEAEFTLRYMGDKPGRLQLFRDNILEYFLHFGYSDIPIRLLYADCVQKLMEHDQKNQSVSYCESLRIYLESGMNAAEAARRLNITRNAFLARLDRIMRYIDLDLNNSDNILYLQICLRLIRTQESLRAAI